MTVTAFPKDASGSALASQITARTTQMNTLAAGTPARLAASAQLDRDQQALVDHFMATGRLSAAAILSTMT